jgi:hypothetical protein
MKRPLAISVICVIGFLWVTLSFPAVFSPSVKKLGDFVPALYGLLVAGSFIAYIGLWHMKQWGVLLFMAVFFIKTLFLVLINDLGGGTILGILLSVTFIGILIRHFPKMDVNL